MRRGKSQVLFRYLPECVVDHSDTQTIAKVVKWHTKPVERINRPRIVSKIQNALERFPKKRVFPKPGQLKEYVFLEPVSIEVELFPLTFTCKECKKVSRYSDIDHFKRETKKDGYKCKCGGSLEQLDLINYHECGKIESLYVRKCDAHGHSNIQLNKNNSDSPRNWQWRCHICGRDLGPVSARCFDCNEEMETAPFRKSQVFYPHSLTLINVPGISEEKIYNNPLSHKLVLAKYMNRLGSHDFNTLIDTSKNDSQMDEMQSKEKELLAKGIPKEYLSKIIETFQKPDLYEERKKIISKIDEIIPMSDEDLRDISMSIHEYNETIELPNIIPLDDVTRNAQSEGNPNYSTIKLFPERLEKIGVEKAYVVSDLPIVSAVYGYTRGKLDRTVCTLRSFGEDSNYRGKTPIYANATETEGIVLEFNRYKVLKWLQVNGIASDIPAKNDIEGQKAWMLKHVNTRIIPVYDEIPDVDPITKYVYKLIHTISHALLIRASGQVGLDKDSLGEILFPNVPAAIIYSNNIHDFQLGGMHTLFENSIIPWIDITQKEIEKCLYDPVCIDSDASCHACLQTSEISCVHFNRDLGRDVLIGKRDKSGRQFIGFWEKNFLGMLGE